jgi:hypothetical protein
MHNDVDCNHPKVLFLSETRLSASRAQDLCHKFGFHNSFGVSSQGFSVGLVVMWQDDLSIVIKALSKFHIGV